MLIFISCTEQTNRLTNSSAIFRGILIRLKLMCLVGNSTLYIFPPAKHTKFGV